MVEDCNSIFIPMFEILDKKNINKGVGISRNDGKIFVIFSSDYLSEMNRFILYKISSVYSETLFYSDNFENPNLDRLEKWVPDEWYDKEYHVTERCLRKKYIVLELNDEDNLKILGTSIMIANCLQEQDPFELKASDLEILLDKDDLFRHDNYIKDGCPDQAWIHLTIALDKDNPLRENPYANFMLITAINSPIQDAGLLTQTLVGYENKKYVNFCMDDENLLEEIKKYIESFNPNFDLKTMLSLDDVSIKKLELK